MTTLRRLLVAVYPFRVVLAVFAVLGVTADVRAQSPVRVGYYDMNIGAGVAAEQEAPIVAAGFTPVLLNNVTAADLAGLHVLFVQNSSASGYGAEYLASTAAVQTAVNAGLVLIIHDRFVGPGPTMTRLVLPLPAGVPFPVFSRVNSNNSSVSDPATLVANGPAGVLTDANLDNANFSNMGSVNLATLNITARKGLLHNATTPGQAVTFSYPVGAGFVIYSSIPLDMFLKGLGTAPASEVYRNIYAPNVLSYAGCGLKALPATVVAAPSSGHYGSTATLTATVKCGVIPVANATVNFSLNGVAAGSALTNAAGTATLANASLGSSPASAIPVGSYPAGIVATFGGTTQYGASSGTASLTVDKAPATITYTGGKFVYDAAPHAANGSVTGVFGESLGVPSFTYTDEAGVTIDTAPVNAGVYRITASIAESTNYLGTSISTGEKIKITQAPLVVTAEDKTKIYGAPVPALTATYQGFVGSENAGVLGGMLQLTTDATAASPVDEYEITPSGVTSNNYEIKFVKGELNVTPATLTVRAANATKIYGAPLPAFTASFQGFVLGETAAVLDGSLRFVTDATEASAVGEYVVTPSGLHSHNYAISFVPGTLTVTPAALTVRADNKTKVYGAALPAFTASYDGFVLHDGPGVLNGSLTFATAATSGSGVGEYPITPSGLTSSNYTINFAAGTLAITPAPLTVRADNKSKVYGAALPALTASYEGFVLGQGPAVLQGTLSLSTTATLASGVGEYAITPSGLTSNNYAIAFAAGTLFVTPAPLTIRAEDKTKLYGAPLPVFTARFEGLVLGDTPGVLGGMLLFKTNAKVTSHVGRYAITPYGVTALNYGITFADGYLVVTPAPLRIRADNKERLEGLPNPELTVTYEGFVLNENESNLDSRPRISTLANVTSPDGVYPILVRGATDPDYVIEQVDGSLTVSPEGRMHGQGVVDAPDAKHHFEFAVRDTIFMGEKGSLKLEIERKRGNDDVFVSQLVSGVIFKDLPRVNPGGKAEADSVTIVGAGRWNGQPATFEAVATDKGEPGREDDTITIKIFAGGKLVSLTSGGLKSGNIQSNRVKDRK